MKTRTRFIHALLLCAALLWLAASAQDQPISSKGTISFVLHTDKTYSNGKWEHVFTQNLLELPGLGNCTLERSYNSVSINLLWEEDQIHRGFYLYFTDLPGPAKYAIQFTWDADKGFSDMYLNGMPARLENPRYYSPWQVKGKAVKTRVPPGPNRVTDVKVLGRWLPEKEAAALVPKGLYGKDAHLLSRNRKMPAPIDTDKRRGKLIYSARMDKEASMKGWVLEGPADIAFREGHMVMRSKIANPPDVSTGHFNYWCPVDLPKNFIVEWEFQSLNERGVAHIFFAAKGINGEDIFDPALPKRDGHYRQYHSGAIDNYYVIYFSNRKLLRTTNIATSFLNKSNQISTLALGHIAVTPGAKRFHRLRLVKDGGHIQLVVDGKVCFDFSDPGSQRWGPVLRDGKIGFRQMAAAVAAYRNFNAWELLPRGEMSTGVKR